MSDRQDLIVWTPTVDYELMLPVGASIQEAYDQLPAHFHDMHLVAYQHGVEIHRDEWARVRLLPTDRVIFAVMPAGGGGGKKKGVLSIIAGIALIVAGAITGQAWAIQLGAGLLLSGIGSMLIKPPSLGTNQTGTADRDSSYYSISGQSNQAKPYSPVPKLYGQHKVFPTIATQPLVHNAGTQSHISALYDFGTGMVDISDIRFGDTAAGTFGPEFVFHYNELNPVMALCTQKISADQFSYVLQLSQALELQTSDTTYYAELDIVFSKGLAYFNDAGDPTLTSVNFEVLWRNVNESQWHGVGPQYVMGMTAINIPGQYNSGGRVNFVEAGSYVRDVTHGRDHDLVTTTYYWRGVAYRTKNPPDGTNNLYNITLSKGIKDSSVAGWQLVVDAYNPASNSNPLSVTGFQIQGASVKPTVACVGINFPTMGNYIIRITRLTPISQSTRRNDEATITQLKSFMSGNVLNLKSPHTMLEMRLLASEKVTGVVQNLSALCISVLPHWDQYGNYLGHFQTRNPADICLDILLGESNPRPVSWSLIDWPSWWSLYWYCQNWRTWNVNGVWASGPRFYCDVVVDYQTTIKELIDSVLSCCHASMIVTADGKWGVLIDERDYFIPRQLITPTNSWAFHATRNFAAETHAFRVSFLDGGRDYQKQEVICYRDGYDASNANLFEELQTFGVSDFVRAWAFGRYMFAQLQDRPEVMTVTMDVEHLAVQRGDAVLFQHDVPMVGGRVARIQSIMGNQVTAPLDMATAPTGYMTRQRDGTLRTGAVLGMVDPDTVVLDTVAGSMPDDLIVVGLTNQVTAPFIVQAVTPGPDYTAELDLVPYVDAMYDSDIGLIPPYDPNFGYDVETVTGIRLTTLAASGSVFYLNRYPTQRVTLTFTVDKPQIYGRADVFIKVPGYNERWIGETKTTVFQYDFDLVRSAEVVAGLVTFRVVPFTTSGYPGTGLSVNFGATPDRLAPNPVKGFAVNVIGDMCEIFWQLQSDGDTLSHELRYSPDVIAGTWQASQQLGVFDWWVVKTSVGARTGKYFLQTKDTSGNLSAVVWQRTTVEHLPHIDLVMEIPEDGFPGTLYELERAGDSVQSAGEFGAVEPQGYYYYASMVDLGEVYEVRVSNKSTGHGFSSYDLMSNWLPLASAQPLAHGYNALWNTMLEVRCSNTGNVMANWQPMASADPIGGSAEDAWSDWRPILVGDVTGRFLQFRHNVQSFDTHVKAVLDDGLIVIDVAERTWIAEDVAVAIAGTRFLFTPPFQYVPTIAININGGTATRYRVTNKDRFGVTVELLDQITPVTGSIDLSAIGYGKERVISL